MRSISTLLTVATTGISAAVIAGIAVGIFLFQSQAAKNAPLDVSAKKNIVETLTSNKPKHKKHTLAVTNIDSNNRIRPNMVLHISVADEQDLDRKVLVRRDGSVSFPLLGDIQASGRSPQEIQNEISSLLRQSYVPRAEVSVLIDKISDYSVTVLGEVNNPGQFNLERRVDVVQAIVLAGGTTIDAIERKITVVRRKDGTEVAHRIDYRDVKRGKDLKQNIVLRSGDVVIVP